MVHCKPDGGDLRPGPGRSFAMPFPQLFVLAIASVAMLAVVRLARVRLGRSPLPDGRAKWLFRVAFVLIPPIALGALFQTTTSSGPLRGIAWVPVYAMMVVAILSAMWIAAVIVQLIVRGRARPVLL